MGAHWLRSPGGTRHVCSEEVVLSGGPAHDREISSAVLALLLPDIPVVAWFIGTPQLEGRLAERVLESADKAIFDSSCCEETALFDAAERIRGEFAIPCVDLTWVRLAAWRAVIAQGFDAAAKDLDGVKSIEIAGSPDSPAPLLIAGWLLSRLDLTPADRFRGGNDLRATLYDGTRGVSLAIRPEGTADLRAVRIETEGGRRTVELHTDSNHLHAEAPEPGGDYIRQVVEGPVTSDAAAVVAAITTTGEDSLYLEAIAATRALVSS
jgi:glucose-6-phosphate dehydrogenase assembly protein OpcA